MAIDSRIAMGVQPLQIQGPADNYAKMLTLKGLLQQSQQGEMQMQDAQEARQGKRTLNDLLRSNTDTTGKTNEAGLYSGLAQAGQGSQIAAVRKQFADTNKAQADYSKTIGEVQKAKIGQFRDALTDVNSPEVAAQWLMAQYNDPDLKAHMTSMAPLGQALARIPQDPAGLAQWVQRNALGMTKFTELNKPTITTRNLGGTTDTLMTEGLTGKSTTANSVRNTQSPDSVASVATQIRGQNLTDARGRESNQLKAAEIAAGGKPPPGYRWKGDVLEAIPGGPGDKLPEKQQAQVVGVNNLSNAIGEYRTQLKDFGKTSVLSPDARAAMGTKYNNMMLQAKEAYNLGVLNGPDLEILTSVITDPRSMKGVITSNKALDAQASELDRIMQQIGQVSGQARQPQNKPGGKPAASGLSAAEQSELEELRKRFKK